MPTPTLTDIEEDEDFTGLPAPEQEKVRMRYLKEAVLPDPDFQALPPPEKQKVSTRVMQTAVPESVWQAFRFMPQPGGPTAQPSLAGVPGIAGTEFAPTQPITPRAAPGRGPAAAQVSPTVMPDRIVRVPSRMSSAPDRPPVPGAKWDAMTGRWMVGPQPVEEYLADIPRLPLPGAAAGAQALPSSTLPRRKGKLPPPPP